MRLPPPPTITQKRAAERQMSLVFRCPLGRVDAVPLPGINSDFLSAGVHLTHLCPVSLSRSLTRHALSPSPTHTRQHTHTLAHKREQTRRPLPWRLCWAVGAGWPCITSLVCEVWSRGCCQKEAGLRRAVWVQTRSQVVGSCCYFRAVSLPVATANRTR